MANTDMKDLTIKDVCGRRLIHKDTGVGDVWRRSNVGDFLCGFFVGEMVGSALSAFQVFHKREPTADEHMEIVKIVEGHSGQIREFFARFNG
ncbi:MAG: hypothetical protein MPJ08_02270 [Nitrosopumilus sp.]|nr:hypothetical protein [Nitrosopumilus sp.]